MSGAKELGLWCIVFGGVSIDCSIEQVSSPVGPSWRSRNVMSHIWSKIHIHIRRLDPSLNRNIGKMSISHCFDHLLGAKPKHPRVGALVAPQSVDEIVPLSQIPGLNLTQFNNIGNFRPNVAHHIPRPSTRAYRARNLFNWAINWDATKNNTS